MASPFSGVLGRESSDSPGGGDLYPSPVMVSMATTTSAIRGHNNHMEGNPVYLNCPLHILKQMYTGGYASKFFYQFPTHPDDYLTRF
eukprot:scaffold9517_cov200-Amphora_coffeaeformis.AAC.4